MKGCSTCLFYISPYPNLFVCVSGKKVKTYARKKKNCKNWVENTPENASIELEKLIQDDNKIEDN